jgi:2,5-diketo-D-gluconate reductase A
MSEQPMSEQPQITLNDGQVMPQFGLGVWQTPQDGAASVVKTAIEAGYRLIDTAAAYGNERGVGEGIKSAGVDPSGIFVTTKLWNDRHGFDSTLKAFDSSLGRLGLETIDLYLIHWPAPKKDLYLDSWRAMVRLKAEGRARSIGVSNFEPEHLQRLIDETGVTPAVNQIELHPSFQQSRLRAFQKDHGVHTESWSPLGQGRQLSDPVVAKVAAKHGKTAAQVIIRWHLDSGLVVIPKSVTPARIRENIEVFDFVLDAEDLQALAALDKADGRIGPNPLTADF